MEVKRVKFRSTRLTGFPPISPERINSYGIMRAYRERLRREQEGVQFSRGSFENISFESNVMTDQNSLYPDNICRVLLSVLSYVYSPTRPPCRKRGWDIPGVLSGLRLGGLSTNAIGVCTVVNHQGGIVAILPPTARLICGCPSAVTASMANRRSKLLCAKCLKKRVDRSD